MKFVFSLFFVLSLILSNLLFCQNYNLIQDENSIKNYFDNNGFVGFEGIWEFYSQPDSYYKLFIWKNQYDKFIGTTIDKNGNHNSKSIKVEIEKYNSDDIISLKWNYGGNYWSDKIIINLNDKSKISFKLDGDDCVLLKTYPKYKKDEWAGNGTGFFIGEDGYIVTNFHVIENVNNIEVDFKYQNDIRSYNAVVKKVDKINDLAILKIVDKNFNRIKNIPYNIKTKSVDVATEVFALGYPLALTLMGSDIKFTSGRISSKTGFKDDITTYQIQVPIQPGNSGGPLFDMNGNLIGIISSGISRDLDLTENVNYAIKASYLINLIDVMTNEINIPRSNILSNLSLTEQIKLLNEYVVLVKVK